jgi:hypothetical protein
MCLSRPPGGAQHQRLQAGVEHEGRDRVDQLHLEQLDRATSAGQAPAVAPAQVDLLQVLVELAFGKDALRAQQVLGRSSTC